VKVFEVIYELNRITSIYPDAAGFDVEFDLNPDDLTGRVNGIILQNDAQRVLLIEVYTVPTSMPVDQTTTTPPVDAPVEEETPPPPPEEEEEQM